MARLQPRGIDRFAVGVDQFGSGFGRRIADIVDDEEPAIIARFTSTFAMRRDGRGLRLQGGPFRREGATADEQQQRQDENPGGSLRWQGEDSLSY